MGDSLTTAFGALSRIPLDLFVEYRGVSWSIGGKGTIKRRIALPNILKKYNPNLLCYSAGITPPFIPIPSENLNVAVTGKSVPQSFIYQFVALPNRYNFSYFRQRSLS